MMKRKIDDTAGEYCYSRFLSARDPIERRKLIVTLAITFDCSESTVNRALIRAHGGPLDTFVREPGTQSRRSGVHQHHSQVRNRRPSQKVLTNNAHESTSSSTYHNPGVGRLPSTSAASGSRNSTGSPSGPTNSNAPPQAQTGFPRFLNSLGLGHLLKVFDEHGFSSEKDLNDLVGFPEKTQELVLANILKDRRITLKEWGIFHAALTTNHRVA